MTPRELITDRPDLMDHEIVVIDSAGDYHFIGASGIMYSIETYEEDGKVIPILVFAAN